MSTTNRSSLQVKTMDHVTLVVEDLERSTRFYEGLLGMERVRRPEFPFEGRWFQAGNTQVHMNLAGDEAGPAGLSDRGGSVVSRGFHFAFEVDDCDAAAEELRRRGVTIAHGPKTRPDGPRQLYIHDPDGYLVELFSR